MTRKANNIFSQPSYLCRNRRRLPALLLIGDSQAAGDTYSGTPALDAEDTSLGAFVWDGQSWVLGADQSAHQPANAGLFAQAIARYGGGGRFHRAVTPGQGVAALTDGANSQVWAQAMTDIANSWSHPAAAVVWHGANDARNDISSEDYRMNLHRLAFQAEQLGCRHLFVVMPNTSAHPSPLGTVFNVREGTRQFCLDKVNVTLLSVSPDPRNLSADGVHPSPMGYMSMGRTVAGAIHRWLATC